MRTKRLLLQTLAIFALAIALVAITACGDDDEEAAPDKTGTATGAPSEFQGVIKIGSVVELSGPGASAAFDSFVRGTQVALDDINNSGGVEVAGKRYKFELISVDTRSDPITAIAGAQQIIGAGAKIAVVGCLFFDQVYAQLKTEGILVTTVCPNGTVNLLGPGPQNNPLLFSQIELFEPIIIGWLKQEVEQIPGIKRVGSLVTNAPIGPVMASAWKKGAQELGLEYVGDVLVPVETTDFSTYVTSMKALGADSVYFAPPGATPVEAALTALQLDMAPYLTIPGIRPSEVGQLGKLGNTTIVSTDWRLPFQRGLLVPPEYEDAVDLFGELPGGRPVHVGWAMAHFDFFHLLELSMEAAGSVDDVNAIAQQLFKQTYDGPFGKSTVLPDHTVRSSTGLFVATDKEFTVYIYESAAAFTPESQFTVKR